uniref:Uncharacterized protein n=1 Tax=Arundo donax TaxID=35708 RepID=A0A0A9C5H8_ARUDO
MAYKKYTIRNKIRYSGNSIFWGMKSSLVSI